MSNQMSKHSNEGSIKLLKIQKMDQSNDCAIKCLDNQMVETIKKMRKLIEQKNQWAITLINNQILEQ